MSYTQVVIQPVFVCASCGGQFVDHHACPTMPWVDTAVPGPFSIFVPVTPDATKEEA